MQMTIGFFECMGERGNHYINCYNSQYRSLTESPKIVLN